MTDIAIADKFKLIHDPEIKQKIEELIKNYKTQKSKEMKIKTNIVLRDKIPI